MKHATHGVLTSKAYQERTPAPLAAYQFANALNLGEDSSGNGYDLTNVNGVTQVSGTGIGLGFGVDIDGASTQRLENGNVLSNALEEQSVWITYKVLQLPSAGAEFIWTTGGSGIPGAYATLVLSGGGSRHFFTGANSYVGYSEIAYDVQSTFVMTAFMAGDSILYFIDGTLQSPLVEFNLPYSGVVAPVSNFQLGNTTSAGGLRFIVSQLFLFDKALDSTDLSFLSNSGNGRIWTGGSWI